MGLSKYHLSNSYSFNLFVIFPSLFGSSAEMIKDIDYYSSEIANSRILNSEKNQISDRILREVEEIKPLFIENCSA